MTTRMIFNFYYLFVNILFFTHFFKFRIETLRELSLVLFGGQIWTLLSTPLSMFIPSDSKYLADVFQFSLQSRRIKVSQQC